MYVEFFRHERIAVVGVSNAADALQRASAASVIVTGILLDGPMDGIELIGRLRHDRRTRDTPIVVLTACAWPAERERALQAGCDAFLTKPCLPEELACEVRRAFAKARLNEMRGKPIPGDVVGRRPRRPKRTA